MKAFNVRKNRERGNIDAIKLSEIIFAEKGNSKQISRKYGFTNGSAGVRVRELRQIYEKKDQILDYLKRTGTVQHPISVNKCLTVLRELKREERGEPKFEPTEENQGLEKFLTRYAKALKKTPKPNVATNKLERIEDKKPSLPVTKRDNKQYSLDLGEKEQAILKTLESYDYPITPAIIAKDAKINPNSARTFIKRLKRKGLVESPYPRHYQLNRNSVTLGGVGGNAPRVHKVMFVVRGCSIGLGSRLIADNVLFKVVVNGFSNSVVVYVDCKGLYSFDYGAFLALVELVKNSLGVSEDSVEVRTFELNNDVRGVQLDGVQGLTVRDFVSGAFERFYNKGSNVLRKEANIQRSLPVESAYLLLNGGITPFQVYQSSHLLVQETKKLVEATKGANRINAGILDYLRRLVEKQQKEGAF